MEAVRDSVARSRDFMTSVELDPWKELACSDREEFILHYSGLFAVQLCRKEKLAVDQGGDKGKRRQSGSDVASAPSSVRASPVGKAADWGDESTSTSVKAGRQTLRASIAAAVAKGKKAVTRVDTAADGEGMAGSNDTKRGVSRSTRTNDEENSKTTSSKSGKCSKH